MRRARYCHNCGQPYGDRDGACGRCLITRRAAAATPARADAPTGEFVWVWCHFFRNGLAFAAAICFFAYLGDKHRADLLSFAMLFVVAAFAFHRWHANVCEKSQQARRADVSEG